MRVSRVQAFILPLIAPGLPERHACGQPPRDDGKITVEVVRPKSVTIKHTYKCRVESPRHVPVSSPVGGRLAAILVKQGQAVKRGDLLFQVRPFEDEEKPGAEDRDELVSIKAPCDGLLVGRLPTVLGNRAGKGVNLAALTDDRAMLVHFVMPEKHYLTNMTDREDDWRSRELDLILADNSKYPHAGKIVGILASFGNETGDITFEAEFPNPDGVLRRGQTDTLTFKRVLKDAIIIPQRATFQGRHLSIRTGAERAADSKKMTERFPPETPLAAALRAIGERTEVQVRRYVYVVDKDHVAHRREIVVKDVPDDSFIIKDDDFIVEKGVAAGERIVVDGVGQVSDGDKVE